MNIVSLNLDFFDNKIIHSCPRLQAWNFILKREQCLFFFFFSKGSSVGKPLSMGNLEAMHFM